MYLRALLLVAARVPQIIVMLAGRRLVRVAHESVAIICIFCLTSLVVFREPGQALLSGFFRYSAAIPAPCGEVILVPEITLEPPLFQVE